MSGPHDKTVRLWDAVTGAALQKLEDPSHSVISVAFSPDSEGELYLCQMIGQEEGRGKFSGFLLIIERTHQGEYLFSDLRKGQGLS